ncbi:NAD(P)-dependent alcohol dehydrogenase [Microbulbifer sp.]|uniref:NAD(P)-dependent alcohol dehydrogenase n=1 Tax=Microbulbifer sp. TaxID=1908541 RepID=UPI003F30416B
MVVETVEVEDPRPGEVLVKVVATGVCHTDMVMRDQGVPTPQPVVLGHEGAGIVEKVGAGVDNVRAGDAVVMSFNSCGTCPSCHEHAPAYCHEFFPRNFFATREDGSTALSREGEVIHANVFGQSSFATRAICHARNAVKVPDDVPLELMGPLGCGFQTGAGAVLKSLAVERGRSIAVFGVGAVGLSAVMAAKIAGAHPIIAVDVNPERLELARSLGATQVVDAGNQDTAAKISEICAAGVDYAIDTTARLPVMQTAVDLLAPRGICGLVGASAPGDVLELDAVHILSGGRMVRGIVEGDSDPDIFIPELIDYYRRGLFPIERLVEFFDLENINEAIEAGESGRVVKPIVRMPV